MQSLVSIIIVNWNGRDVLAECLDSIFRQAYKQVEVIVVDNHSTDDSLELLKKYKHVLVVRNDKNEGFARGNNVGVEHAKGTYVLLLNNDAVLEEQTLSTLVDVMEKDSHVGAVQPKLYFAEGPYYKKNQINSVGSMFTSTGFLYHPGFAKADIGTFEKRRKVFSAYGACLLIRKSVIDLLGLFDEDYFAYFEETDFCLRVWLAGYTIYYIPEAVAYHKGGVTARKVGMDLVTFHSYKNRISCYIKNLQIFTLLKVLPLNIMMIECSALAYLALGRLNSFFAIQKAVWWNITNIRKSLAGRRSVQKMRKVYDKDFMPEITSNPRISYYYYLVKGLEYYND
jgi:GT2 family glycosyltransferase